MDTMEKINKLSLPAAIIIAGIILGGFYFASQVSKQKSIERQQEAERLEAQRIREEKEQQEKLEKLDKRLCVDEAEESAARQYKATCRYECKKGYFYVRDYETYLKTCLQRKGLD